MENTAASQVTDLRQSMQYGSYIKSLGWTVTGKNPQIFIRKLGIFGAIAKIQRFENLNWDKIQPILKEYRVWMTKMEPLHTPVNFHRDSWPMLATKTLQLDLTPPLNKIKASFKKDCRYTLRRVQGYKGTEVQRNNFDEFYAIWKKAAGIKKL